MLPVESRSVSSDGSRPSGTLTAAETSGEVILGISPRALATVLEIRATEDDPEGLALRVEITGKRGVEFSYDLSFEERDSVVEGHRNYTVGELTVAIPEASVEDLRGAELDLPKAGNQAGLVIRNPNRADPMAGIEIDLMGDVPHKVDQLLEHAINPALAVHGGYAKLVGVDDERNVYVHMGGGCQGCSASAMTLRMGIRRSIKEHIPEVLEVIDVTDHSQGENPYYS